LPDLIVSHLGDPEDPASLPTGRRGDDGNIVSTRVVTEDMLQREVSNAVNRDGPLCR
jgi:hypothetical protein